MAALCCRLFPCSEISVVLSCLRCYPALPHIALELHAWTSARQTFPACGVRDSRCGAVHGSLGVCTPMEVGGLAWGCLLWGPCTSPGLSGHKCALMSTPCCVRISVPRCVRCCLSALSAASPDVWDWRGRSTQSGRLSPCSGADGRAPLTAVQPITLPLPSLTQVARGLLCTSLLKRGGDGNALQPHTESLLLSRNP